MPLFRRGDQGPEVADIRAKLGQLGLLVAAPGVAADLFDEGCDHAVRGFQQSRGLRVDGLVGAETYRALDEARYRLGMRVLSHAVSHPLVGDDVAELQHRLLDMGFDPGRCDGIFGARTGIALREFQRGVGLVADGTCGPKTLRALERVMPRASGGSPGELREAERLLQAGPALAGKVIVVDPGHGSDDRGWQAHGLDEAALVEDIAARLEGRLGAAGARAYPTRGPEARPSDAERAAFANDADAELFVSVHVDGAAAERCHGIATYYFGSTAAGRVSASSTGSRLASLIQREVTARTGLLNCRTHPKTWELLRLTRMPAVRLDVGYLTNAEDARRLGGPEFRDGVAEAIFAAIQRLYLPPGQDVATGLLRMPALTR